MKQNPNTKDLFEAEAIGQIHRGLEVPEFEAVQPLMPSMDKVLDSPEEFRMAIGRAQLEGAPFITISDRLMTYLSRGKDLSITYGNPGIRVYVEGAKDGLDKIERMNSDQFHTHSVKQKGQWHE